VLVEGPTERDAAGSAGADDGLDLVDVENSQIVGFGERLAEGSPRDEKGQVEQGLRE
jgi:hypothetical protein